MAEYKAELIKVVKEKDHGVYEVWANPAPSSSYAAQTLQVTTDKTFDSFIYECGDGTNSRATIIGEANASAIPTYATIGSDGPINVFSRTITPSKTANGYDLVISDCIRRRRNNDGTISDSTQNGTLIPIRIYGIVHND